MAPLEQNGVQANGHGSLERISSGLEAASQDANSEMRDRALQRYRCAHFHFNKFCAACFAAGLLAAL